MREIRQSRFGGRGSRVNRSPYPYVRLGASAIGTVEVRSGPVHRARTGVVLRRPRGAVESRDEGNDQPVG